MPKDKKSVRKPAQKPNKTGAKSHVKSLKTSKPVLKTTQADPQTTQMQYSRSLKNAPCPLCGAFPCVTEQRNQKLAVMRCRECGHRFAKER